MSKWTAIDTRLLRDLETQSKSAKRVYEKTEKAVTGELRRLARKLGIKTAEVVGPDSRDWLTAIKDKLKE